MRPTMDQLRRLVMGQPRGTEFLDAETGGQNRAERPQVFSRDGKSGTIPTKISTETAYSESALGFAVWVGLGGGRTRARTWDPMIKSHLLLSRQPPQLSHRNPVSGRVKTPLFVSKNR